MAGKLNLKPKKIYFLRLIDDQGQHELPYVKVGITDGLVADRIYSLQTASPFRIVEYGHIQSEAAELVEHYIHHLHADRRVRREWLRCESSELADLVAKARAYNDEIGKSAVEVRIFDEAESVAQEIPATAEANRLHSEMKPLYVEHLKATTRQKACKSLLVAMLGNAGGINGVARVMVTKPSASFKVYDFKREMPDLYREFLIKPSHRCSFKLLEMPTLKDFPALKDDLDAAKLEVQKIAPGDVVLERIVDRSAKVEALHSEYLELEMEKTRLEAEMLRYGLALRQLCGLNAGIEGVCSYKRDVTMAFDKDALEEQRPDLYQSYLRTGKPTRRVSVFTSRGYA
jgi:hypothetical protein